MTFLSVQNLYFFIIFSLLKLLDYIHFIIVVIFWIGNLLLQWCILKCFCRLVIGHSLVPGCHNICAVYVICQWLILTASAVLLKRYGQIFMKAFSDTVCLDIRNILLDSGLDPILDRIQGFFQGLLLAPPLHVDICLMLTRVCILCRVVGAVVLGRA